MVVRGHGWMTFVLSGGRPDSVDPSYRKYAEEITVADLDSVLGAASEFARVTRRGWRMLQHHKLGQIEWKSGVDFRTVAPYLLVRRSGRLIVRAWPKPGAATDWMTRVPLHEAISQLEVV